ncbi:MAG TPA: hypothetical protein VGL58_14350 [Caulobacteraceae bacterium]|jgi:hypothetical protein
MDSQSFCVWLDGLLDGGGRALTAEETAAVRQRLSDVFRHEIDPAMGDDAHLARLRRLHEGGR